MPTRSSSTPLFAAAFGLGTRNAAGNLLDCFFPEPLMAGGLGSNNDEQTQAAYEDLAQQLKAYLTPGESSLAPAQAAPIIEASPLFGSASRALLESDQELVAVYLPQDNAIDGTAAAYLKLHLLSHRLALPNTLNLDGIFGHLPNVVWTNQGAVDPAEFTQQMTSARLAGQHLEVTGVDKFPKMTNYVMPSGVRIADSARVRLGAYLGDGTTVMHEGFLNFNAGAMGPNMVEGRISQGVIVGANSDLGGSSSTMGTLSGGGEMTITVGEQCLIGANAGTGIPLGDRCTIEAGLYITAGTPVTLIDSAGEEQLLKGRQLANVTDLLFIRNGTTGRIEARSNKAAIVLNEQLHAHN